MLTIKWKFGKHKVADEQRTGNTKQETRSETKKQEKKKRKWRRRKMIEKKEKSVTKGFDIAEPVGSLKTEGAKERGEE